MPDAARASATAPALDVANLASGYGDSLVIHDVSLAIGRGEIVALLGKNGMGKTTLMKTAMGFLKPWRGTIEYDGVDLTRLAPHGIARLGIAGADIDDLRAGVHCRSPEQAPDASRTLSRHLESNGPT